jgi:hypothetical protein
VFSSWKSIKYLLLGVKQQTVHFNPFLHVCQITVVNPDLYS